MERCSRTTAEDFAWRSATNCSGIQLQRGRKIVKTNENLCIWKRDVAFTDKIPWMKSGKVVSAKRGGLTKKDWRRSHCGWAGCDENTFIVAFVTKTAKVTTNILCFRRE